MKQFISEQARGDDYPPGVPVQHADLNPRLKKIGKPVKADAQEVGKAPQARIGDAFGHHHVARFGDGAKCRGHRMLTAGGDDDALGRHRIALLAQPLRPCRAVARHADMMMVIQQ